MLVFRFPCCGRAYPCDVCHDENQDHPMELATRMLCGFCAKEQVDHHFYQWSSSANWMRWICHFNSYVCLMLQPYCNGKPCVTCGSMMTRGTRTNHWEGGLGCRNKSKMSRFISNHRSLVHVTIASGAWNLKKNLFCFSP